MITPLAPAVGPTDVVASASASAEESAMYRHAAWGLIPFLMQCDALAFLGGTAAAAGIPSPSLLCRMKDLTQGTTAGMYAPAAALSVPACLVNR